MSKSNTIKLSAARQCVRDLIGRDLRDGETLFISCWSDETTVRVDRIGSGERWEVVDDAIEDGWWRLDNDGDHRALRAYGGHLRLAYGEPLSETSVLYTRPRTRIGDLTPADIKQIKQVQA